MAIALFMDVHIHFAITEQLRRRGVDVLTSQDDQSDLLADYELLERSTTLGRVLFTNDVRFRVLAEDWQRQARPFAGLVYAHPIRCTIGQCVTDLELIAKASDPSDWQSTIERLPL